MGGIHHLVSRGVELAYQQAGRQDVKIDMPSWVPVLLAATVAVHLFLHFAATYSFGFLVPTLTVVESPTATAIVRATERYSDESPDAPLLSKEEKESQKPLVDEEVMIIAHRPITSKLRGLMRHLREQTGSKRAHWRGVGGFFIYNILVIMVTSNLRFILPLSCRHLLHIPVSGFFCILSTAWIQQMIAMPGKTFFQRVQELAAAGAWWKLVLPVMGVELVETAVFMLPRQLSILFGSAAVMKVENQTNTGILAAGIIVATITLILSIFFVVIPLNIGLVRFQASFLDSETETVVPMDRTLGGAETKSIKTAWKSFTREGCHRLAKNYIKYMMIQSGLTIMFVLTISVQLYLIFGSDAVKVVRSKIGQDDYAQPS